jgi:virginiamycin B lyase
MITMNRTTGTHAAGRFFAGRVTAVLNGLAIAGTGAAIMAAGTAHAACSAGSPTPVSETWKAADYTSGKAKITIFTGPTDHGNQLQLAAGVDKSLWVTLTSDAAIMKFSLTGQADIYATPTPGSAPEAIAPNGKGMWFSEWTTGCVGSIGGTGKIKEYATGLTETMSTGMTVGPDHTTWFGTDRSGIGSITARGKVHVCTFGDEGNQATAVTLGPDGNVWFVEFSAALVGRVTPSCDFAEYSTNGSNPTESFGIAAGSDGRIWFADTGNAAIKAISIDGKTVTPYTAGLTGQPIAIVAGPDGNLYFGETNSVIGRITTAGVITEFPFPATEGSFPVISLTVGADKNIWFSNNVHSQIGKLKLPIR